jgi:hypothetical protein
MTTPSLPATPAELPTLEGPGSPLARAAPAGASLFSLVGRRATAWGLGTRGIQELRAGRWTLLGRLETGLGVAAGIVVGPSSIRREVVGPGGSLLETVLIPVDVSGGILQWTRPAGARTELAVRVEWSMECDGAQALAHRPVDHGVLVAAGVEAVHEPGAAVALLHPRPVQMRVRPEGRGVRIAAEVHPGEGGAVTLLLAGAGSDDDVARALRSLLALRAHERRAEQAALDARAEGLTLLSAPAPLEDALEWAKARARGAVAEEAGAGSTPPAGGGTRRIRRGGGACAPAAGLASTEERSGETSFAGRAAEDAWVALGALAAGDREPAQIVLEREPANGWEWLVAGRYVGWTGERRPVLRHRSAAYGVGERLRLTRSEDPVLHAAARELADGLEAEDRDLARHLRGAAAVHPASRWGRALPMAGRKAEERPSEVELSLLRALFDPAPLWFAQRADPTPTGVERALRAWAACRAGDPEAGGRLLLEHANAGFVGGVGVWAENERGGCADHTASAALLAAALLFGVLGAAADAPAGRVRLAPRFPAAWRDFSVAGIRVGDARLRLDYRRSGREHTFAVAQSEGRIPLMLVFEPEVAERRLSAVRVDGRAAALEVSTWGGRARAAVQLPLDGPRVVTLVGGYGDL